MTKIPDFLYKYMHLNPSIEKIDPDYYKNIFLKKEIYFPTINELNDPYDCNPAFYIDGCSDDFLTEVFVKRNRKNYSREKFRQLERVVKKDKQYARRVMQINIKNFMREGMKNRVLSMSATPISTAMWAHYSNNHKGFCLKFSTSDFNQYKDSINEIQYSSLRPIITPENLEEPESIVIKDTVFTKSAEWAYEKEWRVFTTVKLFPADKIGLPEGFLTGIIFGINIDPKEKELILSWIGDSTYKDKIELMRIALCHKSFDLTKVNI
jgi:hypothetical protein